MYEFKVEDPWGKIRTVKSINKFLDRAAIQVIFSDTEDGFYEVIPEYEWVKYKKLDRILKKSIIKL